MLIQPYNKKWVEYFNQIKGFLSTALFDLDVSIEHIGSTSVPNLAAKAIIDIDIVYAADVDLSIIKNKLKKIGYFHIGNLGIIDRDVFKRDVSVNSHIILDSIIHHLYACPVHSEELKRHLLFRNYLLNNEWARKKYQEIKFDIAKEANQDKTKYAELKEEKAKTFVLSIIEKQKLK